MATSKKVSYIASELDGLYPKTATFLEYTKDYELLFAVILSAQATDKSVNQVTRILFDRFPCLTSYVPENKDEILSIVSKVGLGKTKTEHILSTAKILLSRYDGKLPHDRETLQSLPGVGVKTSGVVLAELGIEDHLPVDTHVFRVSHRLGLSNDETPDETEITLERKFKGYSLITVHRQLILFGRNICKAKNMSCDICPFHETICKYKK
jgi:endonuclease III